MKITVTMSGIGDVGKVLAGLKEEAPKVMGRALYAEATQLLAEADRLVPRDTGNLANSKFITPPTEDLAPTVVAGYGGAAAPYALRVHENPRAGKTGGVSPQGKKYKTWAGVGQWKYLETPFKERTSGFPERIADHIKKDLLKGQ